MALSVQESYICRRSQNTGNSYILIRGTDPAQWGRHDSESKDTDHYLKRECSKGYPWSLLSPVFSRMFVGRLLQEHRKVALKEVLYKSRKCVSFNDNTSIMAFPSGTEKHASAAMNNNGNVSGNTPDRHDDATGTATNYPNRSRPCCCSRTQITMS